MMGLCEQVRKTKQQQQQKTKQEQGAHSEHVGRVRISTRNRAGRLLYPRISRKKSKLVGENILA